MQMESANTTLSTVASTQLNQMTPSARCVQEGNVELELQLEALEPLVMSLKRHELA